MRNDPGPHFVKVFYTSNGHKHTMQFSIQDGVNGNSLDYSDSIKLKNNSPSTNTTAMNNLAAVLVPMLNTSDSLERWERYFKPAIEGNSLLVASGTFTSGSGTSSATDYPFEQAHFSFQGTGGNKYGLVLLEIGITPNEKLTYSQLGVGGRERALIDYLLGNNGIITTRGGDYLSVFQQLLTKTNDKLRRKFM